MSESTGITTNTGAIPTVPGIERAGQALNQQQEVKPFQKNISEERSTPEDEQVSQKIIEILKNDYNQYESDADRRKRETILAKLNQIVREWVQSVGRKESKDEEIIRNSGGKIFIFGSYRLGVHTPDTDIDALCVAPRHIERNKHFFGELAETLRNHPGVKKMTEVKEAFVPVIKMIFEDVDIDLLFARVAYNQVGDDLESLLDDNILRNCDKESIRSLNGCRVTDIILKLVPNNENFRTTLRCVKLWAKNRGIYSNVLGYLGGVAWAILVANICIIFPYLTPNKLLYNFFRFYSEWDWNSDNPILLTEVKNDRNSVTFNVEADLFYQRKPDDLMPIITPAFPSMNSTHNVSQSTKKVILTEFEKALRITEALIKKEGAPNLTWKRLFKQFNFFAAYNHFIQIQILSNDEETHKKWTGFVESKIRKLLRNLENLSYKQGGCLEFRPWPRSYHLPDDTYPINDAHYFSIRIKKTNTIPERIQITDTVRIFYTKLKDWVMADEKLVKLVQDKDVDIRVNYYKREDLPEKVRPKNAVPVNNNNGLESNLGKRRDPGEDLEDLEKTVEADLA